MSGSIDLYIVSKPRLFFQGGWIFETSVYIRGGPTRLTFSNQGLITEELIITSSLVSIEIPIDYTFEFFHCEPERYHLKTLQQ